MPQLPHTKRCTFMKADGKRCKCARTQDLLFCNIHKPYECFECSVCFKTIDNKHDECVLECGHRFCNTCIHSWLKHNKTTCPYCRAWIPQNFIIENYPDIVTKPAYLVPITYIESGTAEYQRSILANLINQLYVYYASLQDLSGTNF